MIDSRHDVVILGGGLAGLSAAVALAPRGYRVTLLESRNRLGGRASSFRDSTTNQLIDTCQHVSMGCCTNLAHFCKVVGIDRHLRKQPTLYFMTPDRKVSRFNSDRLPAPLHLSRSFLSAHYLTFSEKLRVAYGLGSLQWTSDETDGPFLSWLESHWQTRRTIERFWGLVLTSALNESVERIGLRYARKVFLDGFMRHRRGFEVEIPNVPLGELYGSKLQHWLDQHSVDVRLGERVERLEISENRVQALILRSSERIEPRWVISALPFDRLLAVLGSDVTAEFAYFSRLKHLEISPITSVHFWFDRPITNLPHVVFIDCLSQWLFRRDSTSGEWYFQVVISASREARALGHQQLQERVLQELRELFPEAVNARVLRHRVVTEHAATFSVVPGVDEFRPGQVSPIDNLLVAGDWTKTGWPATMEGAVRSGYLAAEGLLARQGKREAFLQPDLV